MLRLASSSQTRREILTNANIDFIQECISYDEDQIIASSPKNFVYQATMGKYLANKEHFGIEDYPLLVADTVVTAQDKILRKAKSKDDAREILLTQSGNITTIITSMIYHSTTKMIVDISTTEYHFNTFLAQDIERYLDSNEWQGKAGACMVEGFCKPYISSVKGRESTAMGLHVELLKRFI